MQHYRHIQRTVTLEDLLEIVDEWTHTGGDLLEVTRDGNGTPTRAMLIDHGSRIRATYTVGLVSDKPAPYDLRRHLCRVTDEPFVAHHMECLRGSTPSEQNRSPIASEER